MKNKVQNVNNLVKSHKWCKKVLKSTCVGRDVLEKKKIFMLAWIQTPNPAHCSLDPAMTALFRLLEVSCVIKLLIIRHNHSYSMTENLPIYCVHCMRHGRHATTLYQQNAQKFLRCLCYNITLHLAIVFGPQVTIIGNQTKVIQHRTKVDTCVHRWRGVKELNGLYVGISLWSRRNLMELDTQYLGISLRT
jgi:hypothetical protein